MMTKRKRRPPNDRTPLTDEQRDMVERHVSLARKLAKPFKANFPRWRDEFESSAFMALVESARSYDPTRGLRFSTLAWHRIRGALYLAARRTMTLPGLDPGDPARAVGLTAFNEGHGTVILAYDPDPVGTEADDVDSFERRIRGLSAKERQVVRLYYLHGKTMDEVAESTGVCRSEADRRHRSAIRALSPGYHSDGRPFLPALASRRKRSKTRTNLQPSGEKP